MAIIIALLIVVLGSIIAYMLTEGKSKKRKFIIWGIALMIAVAPFLSFAIGLTYASIVKSGWAALIMWYIFPVIFMIGLIMLLTGIFKKKRVSAPDKGGG
ncbi:hypothetical protein [Sediminibacillus massiliensis]|uniref:hypothetical protein n=1 Tax=Sediminibacillus massiliensis TaxID=1926277 RepID=UPI000988441E|nr:hypothetical protein [Sediminibacillus massiliensis]